jgi:hypothetical protein
MKLLSDHDFDIIVFFFFFPILRMFTLFIIIYLFSSFFLPSFSTFVGSLLAGEGILCYQSVFELFAKHGTV